MSITVRPAVEADSSSLAYLAEQSFREAFSADNSAADMDQHCQSNFDSKIQLTEILDPNTVTLLAESKGELLGFAQIHLVAPKDCVPGEVQSELYRIYVLDQWHGQGVAHEIMSQVLIVAMNAGSGWIWLGVWEQNPKAISFYRKYGFDVVGEQVFCLGADPQRDLVLAAELTAA